MLYIISNTRIFKEVHFGAIFTILFLKKWLLLLRAFYISLHGYSWKWFFETTGCVVRFPKGINYLRLIVSDLLQVGAVKYFFIFSTNIQPVEFFFNFFFQHFKYFIYNLLSLLKTNSFHWKGRKKIYEVGKDMK